MANGPVLRVLEPNLASPAGHYAEFVRALAARSPACFAGIEVLCDAKANLGSLEALDGVRFERRFSGRRRRASEWMATRESCSAALPFLVLTARAVDAAMIELACATGRRSPSGARLYFHWRERSAGARLMAASALRTRREALAIAPTASTASFLRATGWARVAEIPYPALAPSSPFEPGPLARLLVAGAARTNKGIHLVATLAEEMAAGGDDAEMLVQSTAKRRTGRAGRREQAALEAIARAAPAGLRLDPSAPDRDEYVARFRGALVLTPYDPAKFEDNVSGIALDALLHGAPVVATCGTWQARLVERFGAGTVMERWDAASLSAAVATARRNWDECCSGAQRAARVLAEEHDPRHLVAALA
jgi:hypothetical protein